LLENIADMIPSVALKIPFNYPEGIALSVKITDESGVILEYTEKKDIEYTGEEQSVTMYSKVGEFLEAGTYRLSVFVDNQMIGETTYTFEK
jgi:hypothetical protein